MPTYQYRCTSCERQLEVVQKFTDPSLTECPECSGALKKVFNAVGVVFKGSGFYRTDSRSGSDSNNGGRNGDTESSRSGESGSKDSGSKDKESGSKDSGSKDGGSKDGGKDKVAARSSDSSGGSSAKSDSKPKAAATAN